MRTRHVEDTEQYGHRREQWKQQGQKNVQVYLRWSRRKESRKQNNFIKDLKQEWWKWKALRITYCLPVIVLGRCLPACLGGDFPLARETGEQRSNSLHPTQKQCWNRKENKVLPGWNWICFTDEEHLKMSTEGEMFKDLNERKITNDIFREQNRIIITITQLST